MSEAVRRSISSEESLSTSDLAGASAEKREHRSYRSDPAEAPYSESVIIPPAPQSATPAAAPAQATPQDGADRGPLFSADETKQLRSQWDNIQVGFVDEPRKSVEQADQLVAQTMKRLAEIFADQRTTMEHQWEAGDKVSTEELRVALRGYRSFFGRLLAV